MDYDLKTIHREQRVKDYLLPVRIVRQGGGAQCDTLLEAKTLQIGLTERPQDLAEMKEGGYVILDFGREISGGARLLTYAAEGGARVRLRFGESVTETCAPLIGQAEGATATNDHSLRDLETPLVFMSDMQFGQTGFRFLRLDVLCGTVRLKSVLAAYEHLELPRLGSFVCDDALVNRIFEVSAHTVSLCMQTQLWDGIKRDRLVWIGDTHPELLAVYCLYGGQQIIDDALDFAANSAPLPHFINNMPAYSLWWLICVADQYVKTGNPSTIHRQSGYIVPLVRLFDKLVLPDGTIALPEDKAYFFLDWPSIDCPERIAGVYALCSLAMQKTKEVFAVLGEDCAVLDGIIARIDRSRKGGTLKQVNAVQYLAGHLGSEAADVLTAGGARGFSTFMSYYILSAMQRLDKGHEALNGMKTYYGAMLERGATSFWEDFSMDWLEGSGRIDAFPESGQKDIHGDYGAHCYVGFRHSLCHGWSAGPVPFLMHRVLGINEEAPGGSVISVKPDLCGLKNAKGTYPTAYGVVTVEHTLQAEGFVKTVIDAPEGVKVLRG